MSCFIFVIHLTNICVYSGVVTYAIRPRMHRRAQNDAENRVGMAIVEKFPAPSGTQVAVDEPRTGPLNMSRRNSKKLMIRIPSPDEDERPEVEYPRIVIENPTPDNFFPTAPSQSTLSDDMSIRTPTESTNDNCLPVLPRHPPKNVPSSPCFSDGFKEEELHDVPLEDDHNGKGVGLAPASPEPSIVKPQAHSKPKRHRHKKGAQ